MKPVLAMFVPLIISSGGNSGSQAATLIGLAIAGNPENDGHLSPWQEAVGHEIIPDTHKNGCADEATTGLTLGLFVMLFQDVVFG